MTQLDRLLISDFLKAFSCAYTMTMNLGKQLNVEIDRDLLKAVGGLSSGISTMGDTCGTVNAGTMILGKKFSDLQSDKFLALCAEFFRQLEGRVNTPNCGLVHGGNHLTRNFRRAILTGTAIKCMSLLKNGAEVLDALASNVSKGEFSFLKAHDMEAIQTIAHHFESSDFHCCRSLLEAVHQKTLLDISPIREASRGFMGGIGLNGTLCGALVGGVLSMGLQENVDLTDSGYSDTMRIIFHGLIKNDRIFEDEKRFLPARLYNRCIHLYRKIQENFGGTHCRKIISCALNTHEGVDLYIKSGRIAECRKISGLVTEIVCVGRITSSKS